MSTLPVQKSLEERVALLEARMNDALCRTENNAAAIDFVAMMTDTELEPEEEVDEV